MRIADHLSKEQKQQLNKMAKANKKIVFKSKPKHKRDENLSRNDWLNIMGVHMDVYKRVNGAVRRK
jgi:hypothetical protein